MFAQKQYSFEAKKLNIQTKLSLVKCTHVVWPVAALTSRAKFDKDFTP